MEEKAEEDKHQKISEKKVFKENKLLKKARIEKMWSKAEVAKEVGVDEKTVHRWEEKGAQPRHAERRTLVKLFGKKSPDELGLAEERNLSLSVGFKLPENIHLSSPITPSLNEDSELGLKGEQVIKPISPDPSKENSHKASQVLEGEILGTKVGNSSNNSNYRPALGKTTSEQHESNENSELRASHRHSENSDKSNPQNNIINITISFLNFIFKSYNSSENVINQSTSNHFSIRVALLLVPILIVGSFVYFSFQGRPDTFHSSSSQRKTASTIQTSSTTSTIPSYSTNDTRAVFTFLTDFCNHLKSGEYQHIFDQLTTVSYQRNNPSALKDFSFADKDGVAICIPPDQNHIMIPPPLSITTDCFIGLTMQNQQKFNHRYELKKQDNGTWKISNEASTTEQENQLTPQCGNFPIL